MPANHPCDDCRFVAKSASGLSSHRRAKHPAAAAVDVLADFGLNSTALEETLQALRDAGRFEKVDAAQIQQLRALARAVDEDQGNAQLWRQYREALRDLLKADDDADDSFTRALSQIRGASPMGHPTPS